MVRPPYRAPRANAVAARWVRSGRQECLDHLLLVSEARPRRVLPAYVAHDTEARPHQGVGRRTPVPRGDVGVGPVRRGDVLGGLLREYCRAAA